MTSMITRDEVEEALHKAGVRPYSVVVKIMRIIDAYSLAVTRKHTGNLMYTGNLPYEPFYYLQRGEWDKNEEVTRCAACGKAKRWSPYFHVDKSHPSGRKIICKVCRRKETENVPAGEVRWKCPQCKEYKTAGGFPGEKQVNPRRSVLCVSCGG